MYPGTQGTVVCKVGRSKGSVVGGTSGPLCKRGMSSPKGPTTSHRPNAVRHSFGSVVLRRSQRASPAAEARESGFEPSLRRALALKGPSPRAPGAPAPAPRGTSDPGRTLRHSPVPRPAPGSAAPPAPTRSWPRPARCAHPWPAPQPPARRPPHPRARADAPAGSWHPGRWRVRDSALPPAASGAGSQGSRRRRRAGVGAGGREAARRRPASARAAPGAP